MDDRIKTWQVYEHQGQNGEPSTYSVYRANAREGMPIGSFAGPFATHDEAEREAARLTEEARNGGPDHPQKPLHSA